MTRFRRLAGALALLVCCAVQAAPTDDYQEARKLFAASDWSQALVRVDSFLQRNPRDARARFLRGLVLTELNRQPEAIKVFTALTEEFPELPEPYNNLAVLYAAQGQDDKARRALEMAIRTHPSYATAHENLGDIYAKMAREAYDKALQLDSSNASAKAKLALVRELFSAKTPATGPLVRSTVAEPPVAAPPIAPPASPAPTQVAAEKLVAAPTAAPAKPPAPTGASPALAAKPADTAAAADPKSTDGNPETAVLRALDAWASAWSRNDAKATLGFYAPGFKVPGGQSREQWEAARRERIAGAKKLKVTAANPRVSFSSPEEAVVVFRQNYVSSTLRSTGMKRITFVRSGGRWLIQQEDLVK
ncbi:MAG: tetratricopeptide repeat protein [Burkholderiales bacterium]|nr:tetratricopeptide repeat protein [Burkholderiales bacterium]